MQAVRELILKMADDALVLGHRNSEWTGLGPILEEDLAFSSMAQDKVGHALALYSILHEQFNDQSPDQIAFARSEKDFRCCHLVELPISEYDFSIVRQFLFDNAEAIRYEMLSTSSFEPLAQLARKIKGELKYHVFHGNTWLHRLGRGTEESHARMQSALNEAYPFALGNFEEGDFEKELAEQKTFPGEKALRSIWEERIHELIDKANLKLPELKNVTVGFGGRKGYHTEFLQPMLDEMAQVFRTEQNVEW